MANTAKTALGRDKEGWTATPPVHTPISSVGHVQVPVDVIRKSWLAPVDAPTVRVLTELRERGQIVCHPIEKLDDLLVDADDDPEQQHRLEVLFASTPLTKGRLRLPSYQLPHLLGRFEPAEDARVWIMSRFGDIEIWSNERYQIRRDALAAEFAPQRDDLGF